ncbi:MAG TPA: hypothetical protein PKH77_24415 [Anaerolineae bacterium]|nr:hypothetical protein [Anaerolineae bacterium]
MQEEAPQERMVNHALLGWATENSGWERAASNSRNNMTVATVTTKMLWDNLTTDEAVKNAMDRQQKAEEAQRQADAARAAAKAAARAKFENATDLAKQAVQAEKAAARAAAKAQEAAGKLADPLNQAYIAKAVNEAADKSAEVAVAVGGWGSEAGEELRTDPQAALHYMHRLTPKAQAIAKLAGRFRDIGSQERLSTVAQGFTPNDIVLSKDILKILPDQIALLGATSPDLLRKTTMIDLANHGLLSFELSGEGEKAGPFVAAVDVSGSMLGQREITAKAVALGIAQVAQQENRPYHLFSFSSNHDDTIEVASCDGWEKHIEWAEGTIRRGTSFDLALLRSMDLLRNMGDAGKAADVLFLSDGEAMVSPTVAQQWLEFKASTGSRLLYVAVARTGYDDIERLADTVFSVADLDTATGDKLSKSIAPLI